MDQSALDQAMSLLGNLMVARKRDPIHLVVCGGSALIALNLVTRTTKDVDVLATMTDGQLNCARPLPDWLREDANAVRTELNLPDNWFNGNLARLSKSASSADTTRFTSSFMPQRIRAGVISRI